MQAKYVQTLLFTAAALTLASCGPSPPAPTEQRVAEQSALTEQRIADLVAINNALLAYHQTNGAYPVSDGWQGYQSAFGASLGDRWIPELPEDFDLPRDPANSGAGNGPQYLYVSNGVDYKLIAHATDDCGPPIEVQGIRVDRRRLSETTCWGYGFWSVNGEGF